MRVEGCRLKNVTFVLGEMREKEREREREKTGRRGWRSGGGRVAGEALEQLFKS